MDFGFEWHAGRGDDLNGWSATKFNYSSQKAAALRAMPMPPFTRCTTNPPSFNAPLKSDHYLLPTAEIKDIDRILGQKVITSSIVDTGDIDLVT